MVECRTTKADGAGARARLVTRWQRSISGTTAVEFAMLALPFLMLVFGIIGAALYFFTVFSLESAVEQASRLLRTGQAQQASYTAAQFKSKVCEFAPRFVDCIGKMRVNVQSFPNTQNITPASLPTCLGANRQLSDATNYTPGNASEVVLVWVCYEWELAGKIPFLHLGDMANGSALIQATSVFRTEPFDTN